MGGKNGKKVSGIIPILPLPPDQLAQMEANSDKNRKWFETVRQYEKMKNSQNASEIEQNLMLSIKKLEDLNLRQDEVRGKKAKRMPNEAVRERHMRVLQEQEEMIASGKINFKFNLKPSTSNYSASRRKLSSLRLINTSEMLLESIHAGRVFVGRTVAKCFVLSALSLLVEDGSGTLQPISVYNYASFELEGNDFNYQSTFPIGTILAVKEPYLRLAADNSYTIRVDHPTDLVILEEDNPLVSEAFPSVFLSTIKRQSQQKAEDWKIRGNTFYGKKMYYAAVKCYSQAIKLDSMLVVAYLNRAAAYLPLKYYRDCLYDCKVVLEKDPKSSKALLRAGKASYNLREFEEAKVFIEKFTVLEPANQEGQDLLKRIHYRLEEMHFGKYDWKKLNLPISVHEYRLEHGDYMGPVEIVNIPGKGRGMVTTRRVCEGEMLLSCKAAAFLLMGEYNSAEVIFNPYLKQIERPESVALVSALIGEATRNPKLMTKLKNLYAGGSNDKFSAIPRVQVLPDPTGSKKADEEFCIDTDLLYRIVFYNAFRSDKDITVTTSDKDKDEMISEGLWIDTSYINHCCIGNVQREQIGDVVFITAIRELEKGEEILMPYCHPYDVYEDRMEALARYGITKCECKLCELDRKMNLSELDKKYVPSLLEKFKAMMPEITAACRSREKSKCKTLIKKVATICNSIEDFYLKHGRTELMAPLIDLLFEWSSLQLAIEQCKESLPVFAKIFKCHGFDFDRLQPIGPDRFFFNVNMVTACLHTAIATACLEMTDRTEEVLDFGLRLFNWVAGGGRKGFCTRFRLLLVYSGLVPYVRLSGREQIKLLSWEDF